MRQNGYEVTVHKTDVIDLNDKANELPDSRGLFTEFKVADYYCPDEWTKDGVFIPVEENQPMWFDFRKNAESALLCSVQRLNPVTNKASDLDGGLSKDPIQNYLCLPQQRWLDGYSKDGLVYQFMVTTAGEGLAVNEHLLPNHMRDSHALGFAFYAPKNPKPVYQNLYNPPIYIVDKTLVPTDLSDEPDMNYWGDILRSNKFGGSRNVTLNHAIECCSASPDSDCLTDVTTAAGAKALVKAGAVIDGRVEKTAFCLGVDTIDALAQSENVNQKFDQASMGMGGRIKQEIITDENTVDYYHDKPSALLVIYLVLPEQFKAILDKGKRQTGENKDEYVCTGNLDGKLIPLVNTKA